MIGTAKGAFILIAGLQVYIADEHTLVNDKVVSKLEPFVC